MYKRKTSQEREVRGSGDRPHTCGRFLDVVTSPGVVHPPALDDRRGIESRLVHDARCHAVLGHDAECRSRDEGAHGKLIDRCGIERLPFVERNLDARVERSIPIVYGEGAFLIEHELCGHHSSIAQNSRRCCRQLQVGCGLVMPDLVGSFEGDGHALKNAQRIKHSSCIDLADVDPCLVQDDVRLIESAWRRRGRIGPVERPQLVGSPLEL